MRYHYQTKGTCSTRISFDLEDDVIRNVEFVSGCNGNLHAIEKLVDGFTVSQIQEKLGGIQCGHRQTSCADQLCKAVNIAYEKSKQ